MLKRIAPYAALTAALLVCVGLVLTSQYVLTIEIHPVAAPEQNSTHETADKKHEAEAALALYTLWLTAFTGVLAGGTLLLWIATVLTLRHARETAERQLRAYISIIESGHLVDQTFPLTFLVKLKNAGQTPAFELSDWIGVGVHDLPLKEKLNPPPQRNIHKMTLGPGCDSFLKASKRTAIPDADWAEVEAGRKAVYIYGQVDYIDAFKEPRWTKFCFTYSGESDSGLGLRRYKDGNDAF